MVRVALRICCAIWVFTVVSLQPQAKMQEALNEINDPLRRMLRFFTDITIRRLVEKTGFQIDESLQEQKFQDAKSTFRGSQYY